MCGSEMPRMKRHTGGESKRQSCLMEPTPTYSRTGNSGDGGRHCGLPIAEGNARLAQVVGGHFHSHGVTNADADKMLSHLAGNMRQNFVAVGKRHAEHRARQNLRYRTGQFNWFFFCHKSETTRPKRSIKLPATLRAEPDINSPNKGWQARNWRKSTLFCHDSIPKTHGHAGRIR